MRQIPNAKFLSLLSGLALLSSLACSSSSNTNPPINGKDAGTPKDGGGGGGDGGGGGNGDGGNRDGGGGGNNDGGGGNDDGGGGMRDSGIVGNFDPNTLAGPLGQAQCAYFQRCEPARFAFQGWQMADCVNSVTMQLVENFTLLKPGIDSNRISVNMNNLNACTSELGQVDCILGPLDDSPCNQILEGTQAANAGCFFNQECVAGNFCNNATTGAFTCGKCAPVAAPGADCLATNGQCAVNTVCAITMQDAQGNPTAAACVPDNAAENQQCLTIQTGFCRGHLECVTPMMGQAGTCKRPGTTLGAACDPMMMANPGCNVFQNLSCGANNMCAMVSWQAVGAACDASTQFCNAQGFCPGMTGNCTALPGPGASCMVSQTCATDAYCDTQTTNCVATKPAGQSCVQQAECATPNQCIGPHRAGMTVTPGMCGSAAAAFQLCQ
jgi:hypothetical protein